MSLEAETAELKAIGQEAKQLLQALQRAASQVREATAAQKDEIQRLVERLDTSSRAAARERRRREIAQLSDVIDAYELTLGVPGLSASTRRTIRADLIAKRARRTRLRGLEGTEFGGVLTAAEARALIELVRRAKRAVKQRQMAASFLDSLFEIADLALSLGGRFAM